MKYLILISLLFSLNSFAKTYRLGRQHTSIKFSVPYMGLSSVEGTFNQFDGYFNVKDKKFSDIKVKIETKSIDTNSKKRDKHLKEKDFFHISKFPEIFFEGKKIIYKDNSPVKVEGLLSIKDITKPIALKIDYKGVTKDPFKKTPIMYFDLKGKLNRKDYGITWNQKLDEGGWLLGDIIDLNIKVESFPVDQYPAFSRFYKKKVKNKYQPKTNELKKEEFKPIIHKPVKVREKAENQFLNIALHTFTGIPLLALFIFTSIFLHKKFQKIEFKSERVKKWVTFFEDIVVLLIMIGLCQYFANWMGYGVHPWLELAN